MCEPGQSEGGCRCHTGRMRGLVQPRLLLQLARKPAHGYELMDALDEGANGQAPDPGTLYRTLRGLEEDGLVRSTWDTEGAGPARRVYELTDQGIEFLHAWAVSIRGTRAQLDRFLAGYAEQFQNQTGG
ncbi:MAG: PadR family transcriptional regulator [Chloroflexi bacterium]|nr:PadR family transcriptional regulator [Chloroflexota bacterium]